FYHDKPIKKGYVNHQPALFFYEGTQLVTCQVFELQDGMVQQVYFLRNPDKLASLKMTID
ncbi:MAG: sigma-70 family RNA polymerase sigma factor, partial [Flavisolibacter sp.]